VNESTLEGSYAPSQPLDSKEHSTGFISLESHLCLMSKLSNVWTIIAYQWKERLVIKKTLVQRSLTVNN